LISGGHEERMIRHFTGVQRDRIGRFTIRPGTGGWEWSPPVAEMFGYPPDAAAPSWDIIATHIPAQDRERVTAGYQQATRTVGPFSWSHLIHAADGLVRSILVLGEATPDPTPVSAAPGGSTEGGPQLVLRGYAIDLTGLRAEGARAAATEAVQAATQHRAVIDEAKGAIMAAYHLDAETAFTILRRASQDQNRKLHTIAADLMDQLVADPSDSTSLPRTIAQILFDDADAVGAVTDSPLDR
jgi:hypothetical protein